MAGDKGLRQQACVVLHPALRQARTAGRQPEARLEEAKGLALAIDLQIRHAEIVPLSQYRPATLIGQGAVERLRDTISESHADLVIIDGILTPVQQRNLEKEWQSKVIDRTGLILEIFGARARTREGQMQVELAALNYQRSRLVRSWTHLERQRGGFGFLGGPGESQLEIDRRLIGERIARLKRDLQDVKRTRQLHRTARQRVPYPVVALVGYTNAGKSTLFNHLTQAEVRAEDLLFATLDPTLRAIKLPSGKKIILSDTVGFISDLPHDLVASFRATLEEVQQADLILHVRDIAHPDTQAQRADVIKVLSSLDIEESDQARMLEILNKTDLLTPEAREHWHDQARQDSIFPVSALTGDGMAELLAEIDQRLGQTDDTLSCRIDLHDGAALAWLYRHGRVLKRTDDDHHAHLTVRLAPGDRQRLQRNFPNIILSPVDSPRIDRPSTGPAALPPHR